MAKQPTTKKSKKTPKAEITKVEPFLIEVPDYHQFHRYNEFLNALNPALKVVEVNYNQDVYLDYGFIGIVYLGKKPSNKEIKALLDKRIVVNL